MPATTITQARDEMLARLKAALDASSYAGITVVYDDARQDQPTGDSAGPEVPPGRPWVRAGVRHSGGSQATLGSINGKRRQEMTGLVFMQVFTPFGDGQRASDELVEVLLNAYRTGGATPSGVQFRNVRPEEIGKDGAWWQVNCLADFEYDQIR